MIGFNTYNINALFYIYLMYGNSYIFQKYSNRLGSFAQQLIFVNFLITHQYFLTYSAIVQFAVFIYIFFLFFCWFLFISLNILLISV